VAHEEVLIDLMHITASSDRRTHRRTSIPGMDVCQQASRRARLWAWPSVIDALIIPEPAAGFPHLVTIMLADRLGEALTTQV
jgi:hypothetical protein